MSNFTTSYQYCGGNEKEFVFSCKGRPFTSLVSSYLPTPPSTLIDYSLVKDLNLKMTDLQCHKFHYGGHKMRILGHVTSAVQTIKDGFTAGNYQFSAKVVLDLNKNLDTFSIAGHKMSKQLSQASPNAADTETATSWSSSPAPATSWSPTPAAAPTLDPNKTPKPKRKQKKCDPTTPPRAKPPARSPQGRPSPTMSPPASTATHLFSPSSPEVLESVSPRKAPPGFQFLCLERIMLDTCQPVFESSAMISTQVNLQGRKIFLISIKLLVELTKCRWMTKNLYFRVAIEMLSPTTLMVTFRCSYPMVSTTCQDMVS